MEITNLSKFVYDYASKSMNHFYEDHFWPLEVEARCAVRDESEYCSNSDMQIYIYLSLHDKNKIGRDALIYEGGKTFPTWHGIIFKDVKKMIRLVNLKAMCEMYFDCYWAD